MKKLLIIYPHWPPSNLAGVHRPRLISNFTPQFGWESIVLTVDEKYYEEKLDLEIKKTVRKSTEVIKVSAKEVTSKTRLVGDIALRAYGQLKKEAIKLINDRKVDFLWVPIPSFYSAVIARQIHNATKVKYGIDYIDPWVDSFVGQSKLFSKAWLSNQLAKILEPYSVKKASLISGVSTPYYQSVLDRNFKSNEIEHVGMPYGFDPSDHKIKLDNITYPWKPEEEVFVYAGALLPKAIYFLKLFFAEVRKIIDSDNWPTNRKLYFLGTINSTGQTVSDLAAEFGIENVVIEVQERFPFLHIVNFLSASRGVLVFGSTESHYTASKIFQSLLSGKPVLAVFHEDSSAVEIMKECDADQFLSGYSENKKVEFEKSYSNKINLFFSNKRLNWNPTLENLEKYSAKNSAKRLVEKIEKVLNA